MQDCIRLGTRASALALAQVELTERALRAQFDELTIERVLIETTGDSRQDARLSTLSDAQGNSLDKGVFTKELEQALFDGRIDIAVHSAKDVPTVLPDQLQLTGALQRAASQDVLITKKEHAACLDSAPAEAAIGTSSVRRAAILQDLRADLKPVDIRGNVQTRLRKLAENPQLHAIVLARAGLERLGLMPSSGFLQTEQGKFRAKVFSFKEMLPAAAQGIISFEVHEENQLATELCHAISHPASWTALVAERAVLARLQAGCQTPLSVQASFAKGAEQQLQIEAWLFCATADGSYQRFEARCSAAAASHAAAERLGAELADKLLAQAGSCWRQ